LINFPKSPNEMERLFSLYIYLFIYLFSLLECISSNYSLSEIQALDNCTSNIGLRYLIWIIKS